MHGYSSARVNDKQINRENVIEPRATRLYMLNRRNAKLDWRNVCANKRDVQIDGVWVISRASVLLMRSNSQNLCLLRYHVVVYSTYLGPPFNVRAFGFFKTCARSMFRTISESALSAAFKLPPSIGWSWFFTVITSRSISHYWIIGVGFLPKIISRGLNSISDNEKRKNGKTLETVGWCATWHWKLSKEEFPSRSTSCE